jgi:murein DD-endopeptidase MepM/ murein hydrolase activator NlpD
MVAPYGTPIYAAQTGRYQDDYNTLGGISSLVYGPGGDYTYYAHESSRAGIANGATVTAGTVIAYVGHTGDTVVDHLHFEYHPGGGAAVDPYAMLLAVC